MRTRPLVLLLVLTGPVLAGCLDGKPREYDAGPEAPADLIVHAAGVWSPISGNASTGPPAQNELEAVAIRDGLIIAVGTWSDLSRFIGDETRILHIPKGTILPGLRDHHNHLIQYANPNPDPERRRTGAAAAESYRPTYDPDPVGAAAFRAGIFALHTKFHAEEKTPVDDCMDNPVTAEMKDAILVAQEEALKQGLVSTVEAGLDDMGQWRALRELEAEDRLRLRVLVRFAWGCLDEAADLGLRTGSGGDWVKVLGAKLYSDGWLGPRSAAMAEPYEDRPTFDGYLFLDAERAAADVARAVALGFHPTTHAIGDRAIATILDAYEANGVTPYDRWTIEHASVLPRALFDRMRELGVVASIQLSFATSDQGFLSDAIGSREAHTYPWRSMYDAGIPMAGSSDFQIEALHPLWGVQRAVTRQEVDGTPAGGYMPHEALELEQALRLVTTDAARAALEENVRGDLHLGRAADLVVLGADPFSVPLDRIASIPVLATIVNGEVAFEGEQAYPPMPDQRLVRFDDRARHGDGTERGHGHGHTH